MSDNQSDHQHQEEPSFDLVASTNLKEQQPNSDNSHFLVESANLGASGNSANDQPASSSIQTEKNVVPEVKPNVVQDDESLTGRIAKATGLKEAAKPYANGGLYEDALKLYEAAFYALRPTVQDRISPDFKTALTLQSELFNNLSYCCGQLGRVQESIEYAKKALITDKDNVKALFRIAEGYKTLGDYVAAYEEINKCKEAFKSQNPGQPIDVKIQELYLFLKDKCKEILEERERRERELYAKMMGNSSPVAKKEEEKNKPEPKPERKPFYSTKLFRYGLGLCTTALLGMIAWRIIKRRTAQAVRNNLPAILAVVGVYICLQFMKDSTRKTILALGFATGAVIMAQSANRKRGLLG